MSFEKGQVFVGVIYPGSDQGLACEDLPGAMEAWPVGDSLHQLFLDRIGEDVLQTGDLGRRLFGDRYGGVGPTPEFLSPVRETTELQGDIGIEVAHELCESRRGARALATGLLTE